MKFLYALRRDVVLDETNTTEIDVTVTTPFLYALRRDVVLDNNNK